MRNKGMFQGPMMTAYYPYQAMRQYAPAAEAEGKEIVPTFPSPGAFSGSLLQFGRSGGSVWSPTAPMSGGRKLRRGRRS
jgi:hypothetical protein